MEKKTVWYDFEVLGGFYTVFLVLVAILAWTPFGHDVRSIWRDCHGAPRLDKPPAFGVAYVQGVHREAWHAYWDSRPARSVAAARGKTWIKAAELVTREGTGSVRLEVVTTELTKPIAQSMFWLERDDGATDPTYRATPKPWVLERLKN